MASLEQIKNLVQPPARPLYGNSQASWEKIQRDLRVKLPKCLDEFARCYGSGYFDGGTSLFFVYNPYDPGYSDRIREVLEVYADLRQGSPQYYPYERFPEVGGLYPIAYGEGGTQLHILFPGDGSPGDYLLIYDNRSSFTELPDKKILDFLYDYFTNAFEPGRFPGRIVFHPEPI